MSQRITAIAAGVAAAACLVACGLVWRMMEQSRAQMATLMDGQQAASSELATKLSEMITGQQEANAAMIAAMRDAQRVDSSAASGEAEWHPLKVRIAEDTGTPVRTLIGVVGKTMSGVKVSQRTVETDESGTADFGHLPAGEYHAFVTLEDRKISSSKTFLLGPGRGNLVEIVCPSGPPGEFTITFEIVPPAELERIPLYYLAELTPGSFEFDGQTWHKSGSSEEVVLLLGSTGNVLGKFDYDAVTHRSGDGIDYNNEIPDDVLLQPVPGLPAYDYHVDYLCYVGPAESESLNDDERPWLHRVRDGELPGPLRVQPTTDGTSTMLIDAQQSAFWDQLRFSLARYLFRKAVPDDMVVRTVVVSDSGSLGTMLRWGDYVDLLVTLTPESTDQTPEIRNGVLLESVQLLATGRHQFGRVNVDNAVNLRTYQAAAKPDDDELFTLIVTPSGADALLLSVSIGGEFSLRWRSPEEAAEEPRCRINEELLSRLKEIATQTNTEDSREGG